MSLLACDGQDVSSSEFDEFLVEDSNLTTCFLCSNLAIIIFIEDNMLYGLCFKCYMETEI